MKHTNTWKIFVAWWTSIAKWLLRDATKYAWINNRPVDFNRAEYKMFIGMVRFYFSPDFYIITLSIN